MVIIDHGAGDVQTYTLPVASMLQHQPPRDTLGMSRCSSLKRRVCCPTIHSMASFHFPISTFWVIRQPGLNVFFIEHGKVEIADFSGQPPKVFEF
jgi:hypothetical protein